MFFTRECIDDLVRSDKVLLCASKLKELPLSDVPTNTIGGWALKVIGNLDENEFSGRLVAIPTNRRTGTIFKVGKLLTMKSNFPEECESLLKRYVWSSRKVKFVWEMDVQKCFLYLYGKMSTETVSELLSHRSPVGEARSMGYDVNLTSARFRTVLEMLSRIS